MNDLWLVNIRECIKTRLPSAGSGHFSAGNDPRVVKLLFINFHLKHRHRLHDKQGEGECETCLEL